MKKATSILKLSLLATVLFLWTNASAQGITETESISCPGRTDGQLSFTASAAGEAGNTYLWSDGSTGKTLKKVGAGTYSVTVTGPDAGPYSYTISDPIQLTIAPTTTANTIWGPNPSDCDGTISPNKNPNGGTGTITYHLYDELARDSFTTTADPIIDLVPGNYNIYAVDENGCSTTSTTITVIDANESTLTEMPSDTTYVCYKMMTGGSVRPAHDDIFPVSASFYDENGSLIVTETADYYVLDTTAVSGTIYAANYIPSIDYWEIPVSSNSVGDTILLLSKNPISSPAGYPNSDYLFVASQTLIDSLDVMQPDSTYIRQEINRNSFTTKPSTLASGDLTPGFYMAYYWSSEVPNPKGVRSAWDILAPDNPVTINYTQTDVPCYGDATGAISASAQGSWHDYGVPFTSLSISGNGYSQTVSSVNQIASPASLAAGIYSITATDIQGCSRTQTVEIAQPDEELRIEFDQAKKAKCPYSYDGEAMIHRVEGAVGTISYLWENGETTNTSASLPAGTHSVTVVDGNGCTTSDSISIEYTNKSCFYNFITPNGDGYNDYFDLTDMCYGIQMEAKIFNEAGNLVATLDETAPKWDPSDQKAAPTGPTSTYTAFVKLMRDGETIAEFGESFSVIFSK